MDMPEDIRSTPDVFSKVATDTLNSLRTECTEDGAAMDTIQNETVAEDCCCVSNTAYSGKELDPVPATDETSKSVERRMQTEDPVHDFNIDSLIEESMSILEPHLLDILESNDHLNDYCEESALSRTDTDDQFIESILEPFKAGCSVNATNEPFKTDCSVKSAAGQDSNELAKCDALHTSSPESLVGTKSASQNTAVPGTGLSKDNEPNSSSPCRLKRFASTKQSSATVTPSDVTVTNDYSCLHCDFKAKTRNHFESHRQNHRISGAYKCELCTFSSDFRMSYTRHKRSHHKEESITNVTSRPTSGTDRLKRGLFSCTECLYKTYNRAFFVRHRRFHIIPSEFKCDQCSYSGPVKSVLASHIKKYHSNETMALDRKASKTTKKRKPCTKAPAKRKTQVDDQSDDHDFVPSSQASYSQVTKNITVTKAINSHGVLASLYHCPVCDYSCTKRVLCRKHVERHATETTMAATRAGKNRILTVKSTKGSNMYSRRYVCPKCPYTSLRKSLCQEHLRNAHEANSSQDPDGPSVFKCRLCPLSLFSTKLNLKRHMVSQHLSHKQGHLKKVRRARVTPTKKPETVLYHRVYKDGETGKNIYQFVCDLCGWSMGLKARMESHVQMHKEGKLTAKCAFCRVMFETDLGKRIHIARMHASKPQSHKGDDAGSDKSPSSQGYDVCVEKSGDGCNASNSATLNTGIMRKCSVVLSRYQRRQTARKRAACHRRKSAISALDQFDGLSPPIDNHTDRVTSWLSSCAMAREGDSDTQTPALSMDFVVSSPYSISMSDFTSCGPTQAEDLPKSRKDKGTGDRVNQHRLDTEKQECISDTLKESGQSLGHIVGHGECSRPPVDIQRTKFICDQCPQLFATLDLLAEHQSGHEEGRDDLMTCAYCSFSCIDIDVLLEHSELHFKVHQYYNATGLCVAYRRKHYFHNLPQESKGPGLKTFKNRSIYRQEESKPVDYICRFCDLQVTSLSELICHENRHLVGSDYLFF